LHFEVHPCGARELIIDPLPEGASREGALYPDGAHITDLKEVRGLLYQMQRPGIAPEVRLSNFLTKDSIDHNFSQLVYPHDWQVPFFIELLTSKLTKLIFAGEKTILSCSTTAAFCTPSSAHSSLIKSARSTNATLQHRTNPPDLLRTT
jgi:hypothetical protein